MCDHIKEIKENGYTILKNVIPKKTVFKIREELIKSAEKFGEKRNGILYLPTSINYSQTFDILLCYIF